MVAHTTNPEYDLSVIIMACSIPGAVRLTKAAKEDAKNDFNLETESRVLSFIAYNGLENLKHDNTNPLETSPVAQDIGTPVDGYTFNIGKKSGYIAFYINFKGIWIIKSFHPPRFGERSGTLAHHPFQLLEELKK